MGTLVVTVNIKKEIMDKELIDQFIQEVLIENPPSPDSYYVAYGAMLFLRDKILDHVPTDFSHLPEKDQAIFKEFAWYDTEDNIRQAARHEFARITHDVSPDAEAGAMLMEDAFINLIKESKDR